MAWTHFTNGDAKEQQLKVYKATITSAEQSQELGKEPIGKLKVFNDQLFVATENNWLRLDEIQLSGKKRMPVKDLLNGFTFQDEAKTL